MFEKNLQYEIGHNFIKIKTKLVVIIFFLFIASLSTMAYVFAQGTKWLYQSYRTWQPPNSTYLANPFDSLKNIFGPNNSLPNNQVAITEQPIKIISEDSQVIEVVKKTSDAVVSIIASGEVPKLEQCNEEQTPGAEGLPPGFQNFFDMPNLCQRGTEKRRIGAGSGFLVSADGYIVTNKHVVEDEKAEYTVVLNDQKHEGKKVKAKVLARDPNNDVAILKIDAADLPFLSFGDSSKLQVGQTTIAIGYALGEFDNTVSKGVVSGLSRSIAAGGGPSGVEQLRGVIQTDAAINPGNSGGPLLDIDGNVIGMNVAVANAQSIGFAIPINVAKSAFEQVKATGRIVEVDKPIIGVRYMPVTSELQSANNLPYDYGMLVSKGKSDNELAVLPGSPADKAGIKENDIILEVDGKELNERYILSDAIANHKPGDTIDLKVYQKGAVKNLKVKLDKK